jgi:hypothetical protein
MKRFNGLLPLMCGIVVSIVAASPASAGLLVDPTGDTFDPLHVGAPLQDITTYGAFTDVATGMTRFIVNFNNHIDPASAFVADSLVGYIDIDTDKNPATGGNAPWGKDLVGGNDWINYFTAPNPGVPAIPGNATIQMGDEYFVDLFSEGSHPGFVDVIRTSDNSVFSTVPITYSAQGITLSVPVVGTGDGSFRFDLLMGTYSEMTDRAPNGTVASLSSIPEPGGLVLLGSGLAGLAAGLGHRRRPRSA